MSNATVAVLDLAEAADRVDAALARVAANGAPMAGLTHTLGLTVTYAESVDYAATALSFWSGESVTASDVSAWRTLRRKAAA